MTSGRANAEIWLPRLEHPCPAQYQAKARLRRISSTLSASRSAIATLRARTAIGRNRARTGRDTCAEYAGTGDVHTAPETGIERSKARQLGGESLANVWAQIEEGEGKQSAWQQRMRTRLSLHTPTTGQRTTGS